jgi:uncharacterized protein YndB with AHSA1/START domain
MGKPEFVYVIYIQTTPDKVWDALLDPEMTKEFWGRRRNRSDWMPGSEWRHENYDDADDVGVVGQVIESERPNRLVLTWAPASQAGNPERTSRVVFTIEDYMGSSRLTVTHRDLTPEGLAGISAGWPAILSSLKTLLETGASLPMTRHYWKSGK